MRVPHRTPPVHRSLIPLRPLPRVAALATALALLPPLAGCGVLSSSDEEKRVVVGTSSAPSTLDPAASWDGSWELFRNIYQTLLNYPSGSSSPQPDAAESCRFTDLSNRVYTCELREGLTFSNGDTLDAKAVKHSLDRIRAIDVEGGPAGLLGSLDRVETKGERTVVFHLNKPDATFPFVLATPAMSIVDPKAYPKTKLREDGKVTGSGPYALESFKEDVRAELVRNDRYKGFADRKNDAVTIRYFQDSGAMIKALHREEIDATYRGLAAKDIVALESETGHEDLQLVEGSGTEVRYLAFDADHRWTSKPAVRRAIAQILDRGGIAHKIYRDTVDPLYSMVPRGLAGHTTAFFDVYGNPDAEAAERILTKAGIRKKVPLTFWYPTDRFGSVTGPEFEEIKRQLNASGLFEVTVEGRPWKEYAKGFRKGKYPAIGNSWFPDFPDAENFIAPFVGKQNVLGMPYESPEITDRLLPESRRETDRGAVVDQFERAQRILVDDARLLPLWQGKQYVAASEDIAGGERALDPSTIMQMWELHKKTSW
ncbi:lipoprotein oligopeptide binding protein [Streptomyces albus]|uniref:Lipoprotein oligopeptide binding protein n=1 Tax=Streptomyces albus (strain ATCC 21838 / DSM 41398 / FERM P-419 / JCM 4703 / NBRC 107858) TaxID=1081613 RepID=A0A0B5EXA6_STRA4|nr:lipoprotein oligopeptide binding protein [Streptomyces albus]AOU78145.1 lipoprotein oligopeptide binding protein [Streptomyces albus]AYN33900.1 peptide-binding protein [Streptomyces albus]